VRQAWEDQRRFPLQIATVLSQQFAGQGLQFFKVNKTITHVSVARPHYLDLETVPVSDGVKKIVNYINEHPRRSRRDLVAALAPQAPAVAAAPATDATDATAAPPSEPSPEVTAIIGDLHWLIHQGHVIEFANGALETAKKPLPRPQKPQKAAPAAAEGEAAAAVPSESAEIVAAQPGGEPQSQAEEVSAATEAAAQQGEPQPSGEEPQAVSTEQSATV